VETPIGLMPRKEDLDLSGLSVSPQDMEELLRVDPHAWKKESSGIEEFFGQFGSRFPDRLKAQLEEFRKRLGRT
jgi:phosphoenolpyruvate carboxykinase (GTP)